MINNFIFLDVLQTGAFNVMSLFDVFDKFGFRTRIDDNLTKGGLLKVLRDTSKKDFSEYECFVCVILSHGSKGGICGTDDEVVTLDTITSLFHSKKCPSLEGKPKIFLIEACQRDNVPDVESFSSPSVLDDDVLICYASPLQESYKQRSPFISSVVSMFHKRAGIDHLMDMMTKVNKHAKTNLKMRHPWQVCTLTKRVFFERKK